MTKSFGEHETELIRHSLIEACKQCWNRFGYRRTGVRELAQMANISVGAFYRFYDSKEMLFLATAGEYQEELVTLFHESMRKSPDKHGVADGLRAMSAVMAQQPWLAGMREDWPVIARKLPPGYIEQDFHGDVVRIDSIVAQYGLTPRVSVETATRIIDILLTSVNQVGDMVPGETAAAADFIIDSVVDKLFE